MAQNRRYRAASVRFGPALKAFLLCLLLGGAGVGYVWQKSLIDQLGRDIKKREVWLAELQGKNEELRRQLARLRSPLFLDQRVRELHLSLGPPLQTHVWLLPEPAAALTGQPVSQFAVTAAGAARPD